MLQHIYREANIVVDYLASLAFYFTVGLYVLVDPLRVFRFYFLMTLRVGLSPFDFYVTLWFLFDFREFRISFHPKKCNLMLTNIL